MGSKGNLAKYRLGGLIGISVGLISIGADQLLNISKSNFYAWEALLVVISFPAMIINAGLEDIFGIQILWAKFLIMGIIAIACGIIVQNYYRKNPPLMKALLQIGLVSIVLIYIGLISIVWLSR